MRPGLPYQVIPLCLLYLVASEIEFMVTGIFLFCGGSDLLTILLGC